MPTQTLDPNLQEFLRGRYIATLGTENADGTIHLTAVWYLFEDCYLFVATSSKSRKVRNIAARQKASLMVDVRKPGAERGVSAAGRAELISGDQSGEINRRIHNRYMSAAATADPHIGPVFASFDDVTIRGSRPFRGPCGTWPCWTPKPLGGDWVERPDTCYRWIESECSVARELKENNASRLLRIAFEHSSIRLRGFRNSNHS